MFALEVEPIAHQTCRSLILGKQRAVSAKQGLGPVTCELLVALSERRVHSLPCVAMSAAPVSGATIEGEATWSSMLVEDAPLACLLVLDHHLVEHSDPACSPGTVHHEDDLRREWSSPPHRHEVLAVLQLED